MTKNNAPNPKSYQADRDSASRQTVYTASNGAPVAHPYAAQRAGNGGLLLQDFQLIDLLAHFDRERIPERVVHAKGSGCSRYLGKGSTCPITIRFSTVGGESGSSDQARDPRGFAVKFKTAEGNFDFVGNNTPVSPHFIHTQKRHPATHLGGGDDSTMFWDYLSNNPESIHQVMILMSDRGIPDGFRHMHGYYGHTVKLVNKAGEWVYAQLHLISNQGIKTLTNEEAGKLGPDHGQKDLYEAIERGDHPSWTLKVQTMTQDQAVDAWENKGINVHDLTHIWPHADYPLRDIGKITLTTNASNYFAEVEQAAFSPSHMVPGIEPSADPVLQSRLFSYPDTHRHRLGTNYHQLPVNQPVTGYQPASFQRDGPMAFYNQGGRPGYLSTIDPVSFLPPKVNVNKVHGNFVGQAVQFLAEVRPEDFNAPRNLWTKVFSEGERERLIKTVSGHMSTCKDKEIIRRQIAIFRAVHPDIGTRLEKATGIKGHQSLIGVQFNGSTNALDTGRSIPANNVRGINEGVPNNGAVQRPAKL
ncbi:hypothetical protein CcaverHIS002_0604530 [Cutaneotrichosporon cavernicola]|nr:hypothetical protein CcaverHIS002_0604530 [Cutaneotrichosporon cavernicola]